MIRKQPENKKVKNARQHVYNGIKFQSGLEVTAYKELVKEGFNPEYEKHTYILQESKLFPTPHYEPYTDRKLHTQVWGPNPYKVVSIKYTPDFTFTLGDTLIIVEVKGHSNDRYPYQKKLFLKYLDDNNCKSIFFEVHNKTQLAQTIQILKQLKQ